MNLNCYAIRQLSPLSAVLQVVAGGYARAFSANGMLWRIQTVANRPDHTWRSLGGAPIVEQFFNWGLWSEQKGLHKVSANPILDIGAMATAADELIAKLPGEIAHLPFPLRDRFELWACDTEGNPVALLNSTLNDDDIRQIAVRPWQATATDDQGFVSATLADSGVALCDPGNPRSHADFLEQKVWQRAPASFWFRRESSGQGFGLDREITLPAAAFPSLGLIEDWDDQLTESVVADYHHWCAPFLLTLPGLDDDRRQKLEQDALERAPLVAELYRLYPKTVDPTVITRARVEARLRRSR